MSVRLVPMSEAAFAVWRERSVDDYAADRHATGQWPPGEALEMARGQFAALLPHGRDTPGHDFWTIVEGDEDVGILWTGPERGRPECWLVYDLWVAPDCRERGVGRAALDALDEEARRRGKRKLGLHVFGWNRVARRLYARAGFVETDVTMEKVL
ncbi:MAG TPA: GNAT family N-acetyltransferase [Candidatus Limnocylindrales bacterium]